MVVAGPCSSSEEERHSSEVSRQQSGSLAARTITSRACPAAGDPTLDSGRSVLRALSAGLLLAST